MRFLRLAAALFVLSGCHAILGTVATCRGIPACTTDGQCGGDVISGPGCMVVSGDDCRASAGCAVDGKCSFEPSFSPNCVALRTADCEASTNCRALGHCSDSIYGSCVITDLGCKQTDGCATSGTCEYNLNTDVYGLVRQESCVHGDRPDDGCAKACADVGACTRQGTACVAMDNGACRASGMCPQDGRCTFDPAARACVAGSDADCAASSGCRDYGYCKQVPGGDFCVKPGGG